MLPSMPWSPNRLSDRPRIPPAPEPSPDDMPLDLRQWVGVGELISWIEDEVENCAPRSQPDANTTQSQYAGALLSVLAFAYATSNFDSDAVARGCQTDAAFRLLCEGRAPFPDQLTRFRRRNRGLLVTILVRLLARAWCRHQGLGTPPLSARLRRKLHERAVERLDIGRHMDSIELD